MIAPEPSFFWVIRCLPKLWGFSFGKLGQRAWPAVRFPFWLGVERVTNGRNAIRWLSSLQKFVIGLRCGRYWQNKHRMKTSKTTLHLFWSFLDVRFPVNIQMTPQMGQNLELVVNTQLKDKLKNKTVSWPSHPHGWTSESPQCFWPKRFLTLAERLNVLSFCAANFGKILGSMYKLEMPILSNRGKGRKDLKQSHQCACRWLTRKVQVDCAGPVF